MAPRGTLIAWALLGVACTQAPEPPATLQLERLGDSSSPTLSEAVAAVVLHGGQRDTVCLWQAPWSTWGQQLRAGDGGQAQIGTTWQPFDILSVWTEADWAGPVMRSVAQGAFSDSLWLAAAHGSEGLRLSRGSGCWALEVDSAHATPAAQGDVLGIEWTQESAFSSESVPHEFDMAVRWGDEDQLLPAFWRAIERWGAPAEWEVVCPCKEAFGLQGLPSRGLPAHTPVRFKARISR